MPRGSTGRGCARRWPPWRSRFRSRDRPTRLAVLRRLDRLALTRPLGEALRSVAAVSYCGDRGVLLVLGHDPATRVREARERRGREVAA